MQVFSSKIFASHRPAETSLGHLNLKLLVALLGLWLVQGSASAGAWTPEKGFTYLKFSANLFQSFANFDIEGNRIEPLEDSPDEFSRFRDENLAIYFEYGLLDRLAIFGNITYKKIEQVTRLQVIPEDISATNEGFADVELGLRYQLTTGPNVFSVSFLAKLPYLYDDDETFFKIGNAQEDLELRGLYGRSFARYFYGGVEAAYRWRLDAPSDEYRYLLELGHTSPKFFYARIKYEGIESRGTFQPSTGLSNPLLNPQFDLNSLEISAGVQFNRTWAVEYTYTDTLSGKNTAEGYNHQYALILTF